MGNICQAVTSQNITTKNKNISLKFTKKTFLYLLVAFSYFGTAVWSLDIGFMQLTLFRMTLPLIAVLCLQRMIFNLNNYGKLLNVDNKSRYSVFFMIFWFSYSLLSVLWSPDKIDGLRHIFFLSCGVLGIVALTLFLNDSKDIYKCVFISVLMLSFHQIIGWSEVLTGSYLFEVERATIYGIHNLPVSSMNNTNDFATALTLSVFYLYCVWKVSKSKIIRLASFIFMSSSAVLVLWTRSRANVLGLLIGFTVLFFLNKKKLFVNIIKVLLILVIALFLGNLLLPDVLKNKLFESILPTATKIDLSAKQGSDFIRLNLIKNGLYFLVRTLFLGTGAGGVEHWMAQESIFDTVNITNMHNWWMEILTGYGIFVFIGYLIFYFKLMYDMFKIYKSKYSNKNEKIIASSFLAILCWYTIASISSSSNMANQIIWIFFAMAIAFQGTSFKYSKNR